MCSISLIASLLLVGGGLLGGAQSQGQVGVGLGSSTSTSGGLFSNQQQLKLGGGGLFGQNTRKFLAPLDLNNLVKL